MIIEGLFGRIMVSLDQKRARNQGFLFKSIKEMMEKEYSTMKIFSRDGMYFEKGTRKPLNIPEHYYCNNCKGYVKGEPRLNAPEYIYMSDFKELSFEKSCRVCDYGLE